MSIISNIKYKVFRKLGDSLIRDWMLRFRFVCFERRYLSKFRWHKAQRSDIFYFIIDTQFQHHPGLADRIKAIMGCYYIARSNGFEFRIIDSQPGGITTFLSPALHDWRATEDELEYSWRDTKLFIYTASGCSLQQRLKHGKQYHCYCYTGDDLFFVHHQDHFKAYHQYFNELFRPSETICQMIRESGLEPRSYISVHARFVNALEEFEHSRYRTLSADKREQLIERCLTKLAELCQSSSLPVVLFSDSRVFMQRASVLPVRILDNRKIGHISHSTDIETLAKTYLDFFLMVNAASVIRLCAPELYPSGFSAYAAFAGGNYYKDINV